MGRWLKSIIPRRRVGPHCWAGYHDWYAATYGRDCEGDDATCLLLDGHRGPHVWTPNDRITVRFQPDAPDPEPVRPPRLIAALFLALQLMAFVAMVAVMAYTFIRWLCGGSP